MENLEYVIAAVGLIGAWRLLGWVIRREVALPAPDVTPEGWVVTDLRDFRFIIEHEPPRPYAFWVQLGTDVQSWKPLAVWALGSVLIAVAVVTNWWLYLVAGLGVFVLYLILFRGAIRRLRDSPVTVGVIGTLEPHPASASFSTAKAVTSDGREVPVCVPTEPVAGIVERVGRAEVIFVDDAQSEFRLVLAVRVLPAVAFTQTPTEPLPPLTAARP